MHTMRFKQVAEESHYKQKHFNHCSPNLTWRDLQHIVVKTAKIPNTEEQGWTINGAGYHINDRFGYGALDTAQMIQEAQTWSNVGTQHTCTVKSEENLEQ